ncbi:hypothetical protein C8F04DRAFT_1185160 [Mycena alexandri]|uniref:Uncharacterized protein n=1 Tax=Mycena alexandri TaxID=1745969 RepID=A0AAD6STL5_9AGAR|nr:hypothetical protein C8F04DRAFT_1185160 [Mycena alexandri]
MLSWLSWLQCCLIGCFAKTPYTEVWGTGNGAGLPPDWLGKFDPILFDPDYDPTFDPTTTPDVDPATISDTALDSFGAATPAAAVVKGLDEAMVGFIYDPSPKVTTTPLSLSSGQSPSRLSLRPAAQGTPSIPSSPGPSGSQTILSTPIASGQQRTFITPGRLGAAEFTSPATPYSQPRPQPKPRYKPSPLRTTLTSPPAMSPSTAATTTITTSPSTTATTTSPSTTATTTSPSTAATTATTASPLTAATTASPSTAAATASLSTAATTATLTATSAMTRTTPPRLRRAATAVATPTPSTAKLPALRFPAPVSTAPWVASRPPAPQWFAAPASTAPWAAPPALSGSMPTVPLPTGAPVSSASLDVLTADSFPESRPACKPPVGPQPAPAADAAASRGATRGRRSRGGRGGGGRRGGGGGGGGAERTGETAGFAFMQTYDDNGNVIALPLSTPLGVLSGAEKKRIRGADKAREEAEVEAARRQRLLRNPDGHHDLVVFPGPNSNIAKLGLLEVPVELPEGSKRIKKPVQSREIPVPLSYKSQVVPGAADAKTAMEDAELLRKLTGKRGATNDENAAPNKRSVFNFIIIYVNQLKR